MADEIEEIKIAAFGCWNTGCKENSGQLKVTELLQKNESKYKFMIILGDNYYPEKIKIQKEKITDGITLEEIKTVNIDSIIMQSGFKCIDQVNIQKKIIMGNHDIEDGINQGCSILKYQLKLPWYDVKFPFSHELHYIKKGDNYKILLILYIDTTLYTENETICYNSTLNKSQADIKSEQNSFIKSTLEKFKDNNNISDILICGHEPLITYRFKEGENKSSIIKELCDVIFTERIKYTTKNFTYLCADYHIYQNSKITMQGNSLSINQIILGTGGGKLDEVVPLRSGSVTKINIYKLQIQPNMINNIEDYYTTLGIAKHGYGELIYNMDGLKHNFIPVEPVEPVKSVEPVKPVKSVESVKYKIKYLKYKNKYLKLKKLRY